jgi:hypothetical protein
VHGAVNNTDLGAKYPDTSIRFSSRLEVLSTGASAVLSMSPEAIAAKLNAPERLVLFCIAINTEWPKSGIFGKAASTLLINGLIKRDAAGKIALTACGREAFDILNGVWLAPPGSSWPNREHWCRNTPIASPRLPAPDARPEVGGSREQLGLRACEAVSRALPAQPITDAPRISEGRNMQKSAIEEMKELKAQIESKTEQVKAKALDKASEAIGFLRELGLDNDTILKELGFRGRAESKESRKGRPPNKDEPCPICNFRTDPPHDGRSHRGQSKKRPLTAEELEKKGLTKV